MTETTGNDVPLDVLELKYETREKLLEAYLPFVVNLGLFIPGTPHYKMDDEVNLNIHLLEDTGSYQARAKVVLVVPAGAQGGLTAGIGVQVEPEKAMGLRNKIETYLVGSQDSSVPWRM